MTAECIDHMAQGQAPWCYVNLDCADGLPSHSVQDRAWKCCDGVASGEECVHPDEQLGSCRCIEAIHPESGLMQAACGDHLHRGEEPWCYVQRDCHSGFASGSVPDKAWKWCAAEQSAAVVEEDHSTAPVVSCYCVDAVHPRAGSMSARCLDHMHTGEPPWCYVSSGCPEGLHSPSVPDKGWKWCEEEVPHGEMDMAVTDSAVRCSIEVVLVAFAFMRVSFL